MVAAYTPGGKLVHHGAHGVVEMSLIFTDFGIYIRAVFSGDAVLHL